MLARLILAVLLAAFAVPMAAPAACHDDMRMARSATASDHAMQMPMRDQPARAMPAHGCIGCIPPTDWSTARIIAPSLLAPVAPIAVAARLDLGGAIAPALRPPRLG